MVGENGKEPGLAKEQVNESASSGLLPERQGEERSQGCWAGLARMSAGKRPVPRREGKEEENVNMVDLTRQMRDLTVTEGGRGRDGRAAVPAGPAEAAALAIGAPVGGGQNAARWSAFAPAYFAMGREIAEAYERAIGLAQREIRLKQYCFDAEWAVSAFCRAMLRGVKVRMVMDRADFYVPCCSRQTQRLLDLISWAGASTNAAFLLRLCKPEGPDFAKMHAKGVIWDDAMVGSGSFNLTDMATKFNHEEFLFVCIPTAVQQAAEAFEALWRSCAEDRVSIQDVRSLLVVGR